MKSWEGGKKIKIQYYCLVYHKCERAHRCKSDEAILTTFQEVEFLEGGEADLVDRKKEFYICPHLVMEGHL